MSQPLELQLDADVSECGDTLTGTVAVRPEGRSGRARVSLVSTIRAAERTETTTAAHLVVDMSAGSAPFALAVPSAGPISFETTLADLGWSVEARPVDDDQAETTSVPLTVLPSGGLAVWARQAAAPPSRPPMQD